MTIITPDEAEELVEHLVSRQDIWLSHGDIWVRQLSIDEYALALRISNGLPDELCGISHVPVTWTCKAADEYVLWLLEKYTAFGARMEIVQLLHKYHLHPRHVDALSRDLYTLTLERQRT